MSIVALFALSAISARAEETVSKAPAPPPASAGSAASTNSDAELAHRVAALEKQVAELQQSKKELLDIVANHSTMLRDVVSDRQTPGGAKYFVPNIQAIRDDRDARRELVDTVVQGITRNSGELRVRNDMSTAQSLVINGVDTVYVAPRSERTITVPSGTATTELAGEGIKSWMIGAPNYFQEIIIAPAVRTAVVNAGSPWQYDPATGGWWRTLK
jgi:hypothetical protein